MQPDIEKLLSNNEEWARRIVADDPEFFTRLSLQQSPEYLWIGCSDSRVPANQIMGLAPGEVFVHRNIANVVSLTDFNCLAVLQFAVEILEVSHVIVTGHYGCGGIAAARTGQGPSLVDHWLENVRIVYRQHQQEIDSVGDEQAQLDRLCELNVRAQARNVAQLPMVEHAWAEGKSLTIHGLVYSLADGRLKDLGLTIGSIADRKALR